MEKNHNEASGKPGRPRGGKHSEAMREYWRMLKWRQKEREEAGD